MLFISFNDGRLEVWKKKYRTPGWNFDYFNFLARNHFSCLHARRLDQRNVEWKMEDSSNALAVGMYLKDALDYFPNEGFLVIFEDGKFKSAPQEDKTNIIIEDGIITQIL